MCDPQLQEGDEIVYINGRKAEQLSHEQVNDNSINRINKFILKLNFIYLYDVLDMLSYPFYWPICNEQNLNAFSSTFR